MKKGVNFSILICGIVMFIGNFLINNEIFSKLSLTISIILLIILSIKLLVNKFIDLDPIYKKTKEIDLNDERNVVIKDKSSSKTIVTMQFILIIILIICSFMELNSNLSPIIGDTLFAVLILQTILFIIFNNYYKRKI
ncbi:hypothetical protein [Paraclostridium tenue]|uniref:DUF2178 domain-containing protein n=1 Tax=Paraclostridium tenue TaxID=1737 RepID=A0ABP3XB11_9FIRM